MSIFPQSLPLPPFSQAEGILPEILMHLKLKWRDFFFFSQATQTLFKYTRAKTLPQLGDEVKTDKLSGGLHTVPCIIGCVKLGLHISSAAGTWWVCMCRLVGGILAWGVCVCLHRLCEDWLVSVYPTPPSVSDEQNTYVIWKRHTLSPAHHHPKLLFQISFEKGIFSADYCSSRLQHNCVQRLKISTISKPSASSSHALCLKFFSACLLSYLSISSPVFLSGLIRASEKRAAPEAGRCALTQLAYSSRLIFRQRLSNTHLPWPHSKRHNGLASRPPSRLFLHECAFITW